LEHKERVDNSLDAAGIGCDVEVNDVYSWDMRIGNIELVSKVDDSGPLREYYRETT
jgi:hypothetical protein